VDPFPEKCQLEAVLISMIIGEITRGIPPLGLELTMWTMVPRKLVIPPGRGTLPSFGNRAIFCAHCKGKK
jgi:hypothetical protein